MDNFSFDIVGREYSAFKHAMEIACSEHGGATHYAVLNLKVEANEWTKSDKLIRKTLVLFWHEDKAAVPFPCKMDGKALRTFVWNWLKDAWKNKLHGDEPDIDGSCSDAWRIFNETWGHVDNRHTAFVGIQPVWGMHGK